MGIKFRAWTEEGHVMYYNVYPFVDNTLLLSYDDIAYDEVPADEFILMQSTDLFDKNGVEIFEGDVVQFQCTMAEHGTDESELMIVKHNTVIDASKWEIIGNIWEHPELVEDNE